jgi:hypothetical protein
MADRRILSTGVLVRHPSSINAHVDVVNLDSIDTYTVIVEIFDWGVDQVWNDPTPVPVGPSGAVDIGPHTNQAFLALITDSTAQPNTGLSHYEIRINLPRDKDLVVNCFAIDSSGQIIGEHTVRHKELVEVSLM